MALTITCAAVAGPFEDGTAAYDRGDYATALRLFRPPADQGDARAQFALGWMYQYGKGVPLDYAAAIKWYRLAADQGLAGAQAFLGGMYGAVLRVCRRTTLRPGNG
jgi:TPR repeat protein